MKEIRKKSIELTKNNKIRVIQNFFKDFKESSRIFYRKYLRSTTYYNPLEKKNTQRKSLEITMMEFIKKQ